MHQIQLNFCYLDWVLTAEVAVAVVASTIDHVSAIPPLTCWEAPGLMWCQSAEFTDSESGSGLANCRLQLVFG